MSAAKQERGKILKNEPVDQESRPVNDSPPPMSFGAKLGALLVLTGIFFLNFISRIILAPLLPAIEQDLGIGHGQAGALFLMISLGYFITLTGSGVVSSKINHRRTIILSAAAVGLSMLLVSLSSSMGQVRPALIMVGLSAGLYLPSGIAMLTSMISQKNWGKAVAIHELAPSLGLILAPVLAESFLGWASWQSVLALLGVLSLLAAGAFALFGRGGRFPGQAPGPAAVKTLAVLPSFWIMMAAFSLGIGVSLGVYSMLPLFLMEQHGFGRGWANTLMALSRIPCLFLALAAGWLSDRAGEKRTLRTVFLATGAATILLGLVPGSIVVALVFVQPALAVCFFPAAFSALSRIGPPGVRNVAVSLAIPSAFLLGGGAFPAGIGFLGQAGRFDLGLALTGGLVILGAVLVGFIRFADEETRDG